MAGGLTAILFLGLLVAPVGVAPGGAMGLVFERTWSGAGAGDVAVGGDGSVYVAGITVVGEYPFIDVDTTLVKWTADGALQWSRQWRGVGDDEARGVAVDGAGAAYVTGTTSSFGGVLDAFLVKFDASGNLVWERTWGGEREEGGEAVANGADGDVYVTGFTQSFGSGTGAAPFLLRFAPDGALVWARTWLGSTWAVPRGIAASPDGGIYIAGIADVEPRGFVAKFSAAGDLLWDRTYLASPQTYFQGIGATPDGGAVVVGGWMPTFDLDVLVLRFAADGALLHARSWGGDSHEIGLDVRVTADGSAYVVGHTRTFAQRANDDDVFVLKVLSSGRGKEARTWGSPSFDTGEAIDVGPNGHLYVAAGTGAPPYGFRSAPAQMSRVRVNAIDPASTVGAPSGSVGTPAGELIRDIVSTDGFGAALLRLSPG